MSRRGAPRGACRHVANEEREKLLTTLILRLLSSARPVVEEISLKFHIHGERMLANFLIAEIGCNAVSPSR